MSTRVYLGGLSHRARERDVEKFFRKFGRIRDISLKNGFAFVDFDDYRYCQIRILVYIFNFKFEMYLSK